MMLATMSHSELVAKLSTNRENWLQNCAELLVPTVELASEKAMPNFRISVGFPSRNALSLKKRVIGQCWNKAVCVNGVYQLFISPLLGDVMEVTATIAHELIHAAVGTEHGHKTPFIRAARAMSLAGKPTATYASDHFKEQVQPLLDQLGPYPHGGMTVNPNYRPAPGRMVLVTCPDRECDMKLRMTRKWLDNAEYGPPICPKHNVQMVEG